MKQSRSNWRKLNTLERLVIAWLAGILFFLLAFITIEVLRAEITIDRNGVQVFLNDEPLFPEPIENPDWRTDWIAHY